MAAAVVNASPLIFLAKLRGLEALGIFKPVLTTRETLAEVEAGLEGGYREILAVQRMIAARAIAVRAATGIQLPPPILGVGERSVIALASETPGATAVIDDGAAIRAAKHMGIRVRSTPFVLLDNLRAGRIDFDRFRGMLDELLELDYRISPSLFLELVELGEAAARR